MRNLMQGSGEKNPKKNLYMGGRLQAREWTVNTGILNQKHKQTQRLLKICPFILKNCKGLSMKNQLSIAEKSLLTPEEAAEYFNIGVNKIRSMTNDPSCPYVLWSGSRRLIKRKLFEEYLYKMYSI